MIQELDTRSSGWRVVRPSLRGGRFLGLLGGCALFSGVLATACWRVAEHEPMFFGRGDTPHEVSPHTPVWTGVAVLLGVLAVAAMALPFAKGPAYYVAVGRDYVVVGHRRALPAEIADRGEVACVVRAGAFSLYGFEILASDGRVLLALEQWISEEQAKQVARWLDVPYLVALPQERAEDSAGEPAVP
jgi:hypothetical protein